jgi:imidazoleglycerol phosphate dehydratase HisB
MYRESFPIRMEPIFKAKAKALDQATMLGERLAGKVLSAKGIL